MSLTENALEERIEITTNNTIISETVRQFFKDGNLVGTSVDRTSYVPNQSLSGASSKVQTIATALWN